MKLSQPIGRQQSETLQDEELFDGTDRVYQRLPINDRDHRLVITKLGRFNHNSYLAQNNTIINRLNSEYDLQETIRSDFVIRNHKMNILGEAVFFIQEDYDSFLANIQLQDLNFEKRMKIFECVARGVRDLQKQLICHRSLSPYSICVTKIGGGDYYAKINCFDTAVRMPTRKSHLIDHNFKHNSKLKIVGSFVSPQIREQAHYGLSSDIWSLGAILNFLLNGTSRNIDISGHQLKINLPPDTPRWLSDLLYSMLNLNPVNRCEISTVLDILKVSFKCADVIGKYLTLDSLGLVVEQVSK